MIIAIIAPLLGVFLIIRRQSLMADTLSHVSLAGVAFGLVLNVNPSVTTLIVVVIAALGIEYLRGVYATYSELSIAILMAGGLAVALVLMSLDQGGITTSVQQYLFGSIVTISKAQVQLLVILGVAIVVLFLVFKRFMFVLTFSEDVAVAEGVPVRFDFAFIQCGYWDCDCCYYANSRSVTRFSAYYITSCNRYANFKRVPDVCY